MNVYKWLCCWYVTFFLPVTSWGFAFYKVWKQSDCPSWLGFPSKNYIFFWVHTSIAKSETGITCICLYFVYFLTCNLTKVLSSFLRVTSYLSFFSQDSFGRLHDRGKEVPKPNKTLTKLFPNKVTIHMPQVCTVDFMSSVFFFLYNCGKPIIPKV